MESSVLRRASEEVARQRPDLGWLTNARARAIEHFAEVGFPTTAEEDWRYTDLTQFAQLAEHFAEERSQPPADQATWRLSERLLPVEGFVAAVLIDGVIRTGLSRGHDLPGLTILPLGQASAALQPTLTDRFRGLGPAAGDGLAALNTALLRDGLVIEIADGVVLQEPIYIVLGREAEGAAFNRVLVRLGAGSRATVIEHHVSIGPGAAHSMTELACGRDSGLLYVKLQDEEDSALHVASQSISLGERAEATSLHLDLGSRLARNDLRIELGGPGAEVAAHGLFLADGNRHLDNHTRIDHRAPNTRSRELYRGIVDGKGRGVFNGKVIVHPGATGSDAILTSQNLLLSRTAEVDTKPELEIYTDDVKCSHGATTGQLDPDAIFYLRSRGIPADVARRMLMASFAREIMQRIPSPAVHAHVVELLRERLPYVQEVGT